MFVFMSVVVVVWGLWECLLCTGVVKDSVVVLPWSGEKCAIESNHDQTTDTSTHFSHMDL